VYRYNDAFYDYINQGALSSARAVLDGILRYLDVTSVADFGCGQGAWLSVWKERGARTVGIDGDYVDRDSLLIPPEDFRAFDLTRPIDLGERFDLVQCLEVAEHLTPEAAPVLVASLVALGPVVMFSAAPPGQGGENHINERPYAYWRGLFMAHGYQLVDLVRETVRDAPGVEPWYRYNTFLFVEARALAAMGPEVRERQLPDGAPVPDVSPGWYRLRKGLLALAPNGLVTLLARMNKHRVIAARGR